MLERISDQTFAVRRLEQDELIDFMRMRMEIEVRVAEALAKNASEEDLKALSREVEDQRLAADQDQRVLFMEASAKFHRSLAERANFLHGARILKTWEDFQQIVGMRALQKPDAMLNAVQEHQELLERIESRDSKAAGEAMRSHLQKTLDRLEIQASIA